MRIKAIKLKNIGIHSDFKINLTSGVNLIKGNNAVGKTTIINSINTLSRNNNLNSASISKLVSFDKDEASIEIDAERKSLTYKIKMIFKKGSIKYILNKKEIDSKSKYPITSLIFTPEIFNNFIFRPKHRRDFFDKSASVIIPIHSVLMKEFNSLLKKRNILLKTKNKDLISVITKKMVVIQSQIIKNREKILITINEILNKKAKDLNKDSVQTIKIKYLNNFKNSIEEYERTIQKDIINGYTTNSINVSDFQIEVNNKNIVDVGSQGQKRFIFILLLFAFQEEYINKNQNAILILDDVFSELDTNSSREMMNLIPKENQLIITSTKKMGSKKINVIEI